MRVLCLLLQSQLEKRFPLAEACLRLSPQVAVGADSVFVEISASHHLFTESECIQRLQEALKTFGLQGAIAIADDLPSALACARHGRIERSSLPVEALSDYLNPFSPTPREEATLLRQLGVETLGDLLQLPRAELASRFGKGALLALHRVEEAGRIAWPRFLPEEKIEERADFDCAAQIRSFEPVFFLLKTVVDRIFLRLHARRLKLARCEVKLHLNRFSGRQGRAVSVGFPLPQGDPRSVLSLLDERLRKELELTPLTDSLEGLSLRVEENAPFPDAQRDFFCKTEEEHEAWAALVARLRERLGERNSFLASPAPRLLPEASWSRSLQAQSSGTLVETPLRPLRLLNPPLPLRRLGDRLSSVHRNWRILTFTGPEKLMGEWWLGGFTREYFRVQTQEGATLWVFSAPASEESGAPRRLYLHGIFD